jgi:pantothenate kinase type III
LHSFLARSATLPFLLQHRFFTQGHFVFTQVQCCPQVHLIPGSTASVAVPNLTAQYLQVSSAHLPQWAKIVPATKIDVKINVAHKIRFTVTPL